MKGSWLLWHSTEGAAKLMLPSPVLQTEREDEEGEVGKTVVERKSARETSHPQRGCRDVIIFARCTWCWNWLFHTSQKETYPSQMIIQCQRRAVSQPRAYIDLTTSTEQLRPLRSENKPEQNPKGKVPGKCYKQYTCRQMMIL